MWLIRTKRSPYWYARWQHPDGRSGVVSQSTGEVGRRAAEARGVDLEAEYRIQYERDRAGGAVMAAKVIEEYWETEARHKKAANDHIFPHLARIALFLGERRYCEVSIADVARFADEHSRSLSASTINRAVSVWRRLHNVAARKRLYPVTPIDWSQVWREEPAPQAHYLSEAQIRALLDALPRSAREIVLFAFLTGARRSQVLGLTWDRVNLADGYAMIWRKHRKARAAHRIELHPMAVEILRRRMAEGDGNVVFDATNFRRQWAEAVHSCRMTGVRFHDLRHSMASHMAKDASLAAVQRQLGHSDIRVTMRYAHVQSEDVRLGLLQLPSIGLDKRAPFGDTEDADTRPVLEKSPENMDL